MWWILLIVVFVAIGLLIYALIAIDKDLDGY